MHPEFECSRLGAVSCHLRAQIGNLGDVAPRVSILVPSYNHAQFLGAAIESVLGQTLEDWELVIVDDGSEDASIETIASYKDQRITFRRNESNLGTYGTLLRALELSTGELVAVLNSDDVWAPDKLRFQVEALARNFDAPLAYSLGRAIDAKGEVVVDELPSDWPTTERANLAPYLFQENRILASSVVFRRAAAAFEPRLRYSGDWWSLLKNCPREFVCVSEQLVGWRQHSTNSYRRSAGVTFEEIAVREALLASTLADQVPPDARGICWYHLSALYILIDDPIAARRAARHATSLMLDRRAAQRRQWATWLPRKTAFHRLWPGVTAPIQPPDYPVPNLEL